LIVIGLIAGVLAKWVMPGPDPGGIIITVLIGGQGITQISLGSILVATLGAIILLAIYRLITRRAV
jgi:uncharacterized membrane protein YeaQ/YmgE (transglycosylase-associated protein family)